MYESCKYCDKPVYKTNGKSEPICYNRAHTGSCEPIKPRRVIQTIRRNDRCPCGSGKKFKKCCMNKDIDLSNMK